jgi:hypothetical protein
MRKLRKREGRGITDVRGRERERESGLLKEKGRQ